jgi:aldehyde:ferredoxin oxidoreductase
MLNPEYCAELYQVVTGIEITSEEVLQAGERSLALERVFNCREGFDRKEDEPPEKWVRRSTWVDGREIKPLSQKTVDHMLDIYYRERGWDDQGVPESKKLRELQIENVK